MPTDYDDALTTVLDGPAEAAQVVFPRHAGSVLWGLRRRLGPSTAERSLKTSNLLTVTADRVLIFPQHLSRRTGLTLLAPVVDWPRAAVQVSAERRCHTFTGDSDRMEGEGSDYLLVGLSHAEQTVQVELHRKGHQRMVRALGAPLTGSW